MENYTVENIIKNKQCVYCGAEEKLKQQTFVVQEETKIEFREYICKDEKCLKIKDKLLLEMSLEEFNNWKYVDQYGNMSTEIQFTSDLRRELEKVERYDLLINLRDGIQKN